MPALSANDPESEGLKSRILTIATRRFAAHGFAATSVRDIVEEAGCTKPALYYYFESKEALFLAAVERAHAMVGGLLRNSEAPVREFLRDSTLDLFRFVETHPDELRLLFRAEGHARQGASPHVDLQSFRDQSLEHMTAIFEQGVQRGELRADLDPAHAAVAMSGMVNFYLQLWLDGRPLAPRAADTLVDLFMRGAGQ